MKTLKSYLGLAFCIMVGLIPTAILWGLVCGACRLIDGPNEGVIQFMVILVACGFTIWTGIVGFALTCALAAMFLAIMK